MTSDRPVATTDADAAAIDWLVRLHSGAATRADHQGFAAWRADGPGNERAAAAAERLWDRLGDAGRPFLAGIEAAPSRPTRRRLLQTGLATAAIAAGGLALLPRYPSAAFATGTGELTTVTLAGDATAALDARTGLRLAEGGAVELLGGRAVVATAAGAAATVAAGRHAVRLPAGAEVELDARAPDLRLAVLTGTAELRPAGLPARRLAARSGVTLPAAGGIVPLSRLELAEAGAWRRGQLVYHDRPLGTVLSDLERYRGGRILALDPDLAARRVTGTFPLATPDAALDAIAATLDVAVTRLPLLAVVHRA